MRIFFSIPIFTETAVAAHDVSSHASNAWLLGLCGALQDEGVALRFVGHVPARVWPLGKRLWPGSEHELSPSFEQRMVRYLNVPWVRTLWLSYGYRHALSRELRDQKEAFVCTYNTLPWQMAGAKAAARQGARWISFVLDDETVASRGWSGYRRLTQMAAGHVFVSQWAYDHAPVDNKFLLEGGIDAWQAREEEARSTVPSIMYAGALSSAAGVSELLEMIDALQDRKVEFWICGKGACAALSHCANRDRRIRLLGYLPAHEYEARLRAAWVLVCPRSATHPGRHMNFPSKLLRYLSYGKPTVAVWTEGIPADYWGVLRVIDPSVVGTSPRELGGCLARAVEEILSWDADSRGAWRDKIRTFAVPDKLWRTRAKQLIAFLERTERAVPVLT